MSSVFYAQKALLDDGWANDILIEVSTTGIIESITTDSPITKDAERLNGVLIPGMPNLHSHAFQRAFAGFSEARGETDDSFWTWRKIMYQFVDKVTPGQAYTIARQLYIEMLKAGYTSVAEFHYLHHDNTGNRYSDPAEMSHSVINAAVDVGLFITVIPASMNNLHLKDNDDLLINRKNIISCSMLFLHIIVQIRGFDWVLLHTH